MNVPFTLADPALDKPFLQEAKAAGLTNLKGHRVVGGMRASLYNAMPEAGVDALDRVHGRLREAARVSAMSDVQDPHAEQHRGRRPRPAAARSLRGRIGVRRGPTRSCCARSRCTTWRCPTACSPSAARAPARTTFPVAKLSKLGMPVFNTPGANANAVKELVIAGLLMAARNLPQALDYVAHARGVRRRARQGRRGRQEAVRRLRAAEAHARRRRPGRDRRRGRERGAEARHAGARLRPRDHGAARVAAVVGRAESREPRRPVRARRRRHACTCRSPRPPTSSSTRARLEAMRRGAVHPELLARRDRRLRAPSSTALDRGKLRALRDRLSDARAARSSEGHLLAAPRRVDRRSRRELRRHGRRQRARVPRERQRHALRELPRDGAAAHAAASRRDSAQERAEHGRADPDVRSRRRTSTSPTC